jgi:hypothetical protein
LFDSGVEKLLVLRGCASENQRMATARKTHPAALDSAELLAQCDVRRVRRSGPGGQRRNKVETGIVLRYRSTEIEVEASERRSQEQNRAAALRRLRIRMALTIRIACNADDEPNALWQSRCRNKRISVNPDHADFPALLAEAMDFVQACEWDTSKAAGRLGCTHSQLVRFLGTEPHAMSAVNSERVARGLRRLK